MAQRMAEVVTALVAALAAGAASHQGSAPDVNHSDVAPTAAVTPISSSAAAPKFCRTALPLAAPVNPPTTVADGAGVQPETAPQPASAPSDETPAATGGEAVNDETVEPGQNYSSAIESETAAPAETGAEQSGADGCFTDTSASQIADPSSTDYMAATAPTRRRNHRGEGQQSQGDRPQRNGSYQPREAYPSRDQYDPNNPSGSRDGSTRRPTGSRSHRPNPSQPADGSAYGSDGSSGPGDGSGYRPGSHRPTRSQRGSGYGPAYGTTPQSGPGVGSIQRPTRRHQAPVDNPAAAPAAPARSGSGGGGCNSLGSGPPGSGVSVAKFACGQQGTPYVLGGNGGKGGYDCSGLTAASYQAAGVWPKGKRGTAQTQFNQSPHVPAGAALKPGDSVFFSPTSSPSDIGHVGVVVGNGRMVAAPEPGKVVIEQPIPTKGFMGATRPAGS